jgi:hypothetical protein
MFSVHYVDKTMLHHTAHVCVRACARVCGCKGVSMTLDGLSVPQTHKPFNVWMQRSLHDTGWPFSASNTHKPFNMWMENMTLDGLALPQTHINHLMCGCKGVSMTLDGLSFPQPCINLLKCGCEGVSRALHGFSVPLIPKTWWDFVGDENMMKTVVGMLLIHKPRDLHWSPSDSKSKYLFHTHPLKELFGMLVSAMRKHFLYKFSIFNHPTNFYLPERSSLLSITVPCCHSFFHELLNH